MQRWVGRSVGRWFPEGEGKSQRKRGKKGEGGAWLERERERRGKEEEKGERRTMPPPPSGRRSTHGPTDRAGLMHAEEERERGFGRRREWKEKLVLREGRGMHREGGGQQRLWRKKGGRGYKRYGARRGGGASERGPKGGGERPSQCPPPWFFGAAAGLTGKEKGNRRGEEGGQLISLPPSRPSRLERDFRPQKRRDLLRFRQSEQRRPPARKHAPPTHPPRLLQYSDGGRPRPPLALSFAGSRRGGRKERKEGKKRRRRRKGSLFPSTPSFCLRAPSSSSSAHPLPILTCPSDRGGGGGGGGPSQGGGGSRDKTSFLCYSQ